MNPDFERGLSLVENIIIRYIPKIVVPIPTRTPTSITTFLRM